MGVLGGGRGLPSFELFAPRGPSFLYSIQQRLNATVVNQNAVRINLFAQFFIKSIRFFPQSSPPTSERKIVRGTRCQGREGRKRPNSHVFVVIMRFFSGPPSTLGPFNILPYPVPFCYEARHGQAKTPHKRSTCRRRWSALQYFAATGDLNGPGNSAVKASVPAPLLPLKRDVEKN